MISTTMAADEIQPLSSLLRTAMQAAGVIIPNKFLPAHH